VGQDSFPFKKENVLGIAPSKKKELAEKPKKKQQKTKLNEKKREARQC